MLRRKKRAISDEKKEVITGKLRDINNAIKEIESEGGTVPVSLLNARNKYQSELNPNKYNARKVEYNGIKFDSQLEMNFAEFLDKLSIPYKHQVPFGLQDGFSLNTEGNKEKIQPIKFIADFLIHNKIIVDVKGGKATQTEQFNIKWKMLKHRFMDRYWYFKIEKKSEFPLILRYVEKAKDLINNGEVC